MVRSLKNSKKGAYFFVVDALIGIMIFSMTVFIISGFNVYDPSDGAIVQHLDLVSQDLFETQALYMDSSSQFLQDLRKNPHYVEEETLDEFIYSLYLSGDVVSPSYLVGNVTNWIESSYGINYSIDTGDETITIYYRESETTSYEDSSTSFSREKATLLGSNITHYIKPAFSKVVLWR